MAEDTKFSQENVLAKMAKLQQTIKLSTNEDQIASAMAAMLRLSVAHKIDMEAANEAIEKNLDPLKSYIKDTGFEYEVRVPTEWNFIRQILITFFNVNTMEDRHALGRGRSITHFIGKKEDIEIAKFVYAQLNFQFKSIWDNKKSVYRLKTTDKRGYYLGLMAGLMTRLHSETKKIESELGLTIIKDPKIAEATKSLFSECHSKAVAKYDRNEVIVKRGIHDSDNLRIRQGISASNENKILQLT